jgi:hypothetical protein
MQVNRLFNKMWDLCDEDDNHALLKWIEGKLSKHKNDIDIKYAYLEVLNWIHYDNEREQKEPEVIRLCTDVVRAKGSHDALTVAKAYTYRGEMKYLAIDRRKDFDNARALLKRMDQKNPEVKFLNQIIDTAYPLPRREYLFMDYSTFRNQN